MRGGHPSTYSSLLPFTEHPSRSLCRILPLPSRSRLTFSISSDGDPRLQTDEILARRIEAPAGYGGEVVLCNGVPDSTEEVQTEVLRRCSDGGGDDLWKYVEISVEEGAEASSFSDSRLPNVVVIDMREEMEVDDGRTPYCHSEFFDASDDFWRNGLSSQGSPFYRSSLQADLDYLRMDLLLEIERRKRAEEAVQNMHDQWERIAKQLSQVGLLLPMIDKSSNLVQEDEGGEALSHEVVIARFVVGLKLKQKQMHLLTQRILKLQGFMISCSIKKL